MKKTIFILNWDLNIELTGMNKVMLHRSKLLSTDQFQPVILTSDYKRDYARVESELRATGMLHPDVKMLNIYDYYRQKFSSDVVSQASREYYEKKRVKFEDDFWVEDGDDFARYFENGQYVKYKKWDKNGVLRFIDYFDENRVRSSREEFHQLGYKSRETLFHPANNKKNQENYFTADGFCFLTIWYNHLTGGQQRVFLFDPKFPKAFDFKNRPEFHQFWLAELCALEAVKPVVISEEFSIADRVAGIDDELAYKVFVLHTSHLEAPYTAGSKQAKGAKHILEAIPKGYATVVSTEAQQLDLHSDIGNRGNIVVIPPAVDTTSPTVKKRQNVFSVVAKLTADRQVEHAIQAMSKVVQEHPEAQLEIYGIGGELANLKKAVVELKLKKQIIFKGYVKAIDEAYASTLATIITSKSEGSSYTYQEAAMNGTPVISYKINYGPAQYIKHDQTGLLVDADQVEQLAGAMIYALEHPEHMNELGEQAKLQAQQLFTEQQFKEKWFQVIDTAIHHSPKINLV